MSRTKKASGSKGSGQRSRSQRPRRHVYRRILVVSEGEVTERQYVERFGQVLRTNGANVSVITAHAGSDPVSVVEKCIEKRKEERYSKREGFDHCVCLVDVDSHAHLDDAIALAHSNDITVIVTNVKFEQWLLWHVSDSLGEKTSQELDELMIKHSLFLKEKHLAADFPFHGVDRAIMNARNADAGLAANRKGASPSSAFPILVQLMRGGAS